MAKDRLVPSASDIARTTARQFLFGDKFSWRGAISGFVLLIAFALIMPRMDSLDSSPFPMFLFVLVFPVFEAAYREYRIGGSPRLVIAAAMTTAIVGLVWAAVFFALWWMLGGRLGLNPFGWLFGLFFGLPMEVQVGALVALMVALVVGHVVRKPARERESARFEAEIRAERARRGKAPSA